jgi:glycosyltransferase involved in cell wall biosynthesis
MKFSLIMATIGRYMEVERFLKFLDQQTYRNFELLIVDQNNDDRLLLLIQRYKAKYSLIHLRSEKGLSLARNVGLRHITGDFVCFPDDDCWYDPQALEQVHKLFHLYPQYGGITGRAIDGEGQDAAGKYDKTSGLVDVINVWRRAISFTIFFRRQVCENIGGFDEEIGIGANTIYGSGEETDYVLRAIRKYQVFYSADFTINHPNPLIDYSPQVISRGYRYGCGFGKVVDKHGYNFRFKLRALVRPFLGMILHISTLELAKSHYYWNTFRGRLRGML